MSKPPGLEMVLRDGALCMGVTRRDAATDAVWDAVQEALAAGWTPERFKSEAAEAWRHELAERAKHEPQEFFKP